MVIGVILPCAGVRAPHRPQPLPAAPAATACRKGNECARGGLDQAERGSGAVEQSALDRGKLLLSFVVERGMFGGREAREDQRRVQDGADGRKVALVDGIV